jgi:branched-chain amino acid aminotransferase
MTVLEEMGYQIEERKINVDELIDWYKKGELTEVFGAGTAATVSMIRELKYRDFVMEFDTSKWVVAPAALSALNEIRYGKVADTHEWLFRV